MDQRPGFEAWYRDEHPRLLGSMVVIIGSLDEAREVVDEACSRAFARWDRVREMDRPGAWAYQVALNVARRRARRRALEARLLRRVSTNGNVPAAAGETWDLVRRLPARQREAVVLRYVADLPEADVARVMGVRRGTVSATLVAARRSLRRQVDGTEREGAQ